MSLYLESGEIYAGHFLGGEPKAGEVVFNTSHSGYEEMATDPSYFSQILVTTATQQGNYGVDHQVWESRRLWIHGFVCLEMQNSDRDRSWLDRLVQSKVPVLSEVDTRKLTLQLRSSGTPWGAIIDSSDPKVVKEKAQALIKKAKSMTSDWTSLVTSEKDYELEGLAKNGPKIAIIDFGSKENIIREARLRASKVKVFRASASAEEIKSWSPDGILLSNGPGDPSAVKPGIQTVRDLLGWRFIFGICMGHQVLALALGGATYKLKFGHRGSNHPIHDKLLNRVYMTSQNHGYNVDLSSLGSSVEVSHINLNDNTVAGMISLKNKCMSVQFHPESHPGPHDSVGLFDYFIRQLA